MGARAAEEREAFRGIVVQRQKGHMLAGRLLAPAVGRLSLLLLGRLPPLPMGRLGYRPLSLLLNLVPLPPILRLRFLLMGQPRSLMLRYHLSLLLGHLRSLLLRYFPPLLLGSCHLLFLLHRSPVPLLYHPPSPPEYRPPTSPARPSAIPLSELSPPSTPSPGGSPPTSFF